MDVALHRAGVTFVLDRAGVTGDDGASHNGMWDLSLLQVVPGLRIAAPRDARHPARRAARGPRRRRRADGGAVPQGRGAAPTSPRSTASAASTCCAAAATRDVLRRRRRRDGADLPRGRRPAGRPGHRASPSSTRAGSSRSTPRCRRSPPSTGSSSPSRTTAGPAESARACRRLCATRRRTPLRDFGIPQRFLRTTSGPSCWRPGLSAQEISRAVVETMAGLDIQSPDADDAAGPADGGPNLAARRPDPHGGTGAQR